MSQETYRMFTVAIQGYGPVKVRATTKHHALDKAYYENKDHEPDRSKYQCGNVVGRSVKAQAVVDKM